jgi:hypothetical protein
MSKIDSWLLLTILKIPIPIGEVLNGLYHQSIKNALSIKSACAM